MQFNNNIIKKKEDNIILLYLYITKVGRSHFIFHRETNEKKGQVLFHDLFQSALFSLPSVLYYPIIICFYII